MLTPGNRKFGGSLIWGFGLPSGNPTVCVGMTATCQSHCYAKRIEAYRSSAAAKYQKNLELTRLPDFAQRMRYFILIHDVKVVRIHTGGEFYSVRYIRQWQRVIDWLPEVQFFTYTRSWRIPFLKVEIDRLAASPNARVWYSCDMETGIPADVPANVRLCWLMTHPKDVPLQPVDLIFRILRLRKLPLPTVSGSRVCPDENGKTYAVAPHCESCGYCWRQLPSDHQSLLKPLKLKEVTCSS